MTPQAGIIENVVERATHLIQKSGQELNPVQIKSKNNKKLAAAGKVLQKVGDSGGKRFDDIRKQRADKAKSAILPDNIQANTVVVQTE